MSSGRRALRRFLLASSGFAVCDKPRNFHRRRPPCQSSAPKILSRPGTTDKRGGSSEETRPPIVTLLTSHPCSLFTSARITPVQIAHPTSANPAPEPVQTPHPNHHKPSRNHHNAKLERFDAGSAELPFSSNAISEAWNPSSKGKSNEASPKIQSSNGRICGPWPDVPSEDVGSPEPPPFRSAFDHSPRPPFPLSTRRQEL